MSERSSLSNIFSVTKLKHAQKRDMVQLFFVRDLYLYMNIKVLVSKVLSTNILPRSFHCTFCKERERQKKSPRELRYEKHCID